MRAVKVQKKNLDDDWKKCNILYMDCLFELDDILV